MVIIIAQLFWITLACMDGFIQAHYYSFYPSEKKYRNLHGFYVFQRGILLFVLCYGLWWNISSIECFIFAFSSCCTYSFFHNGFYYMTRHKLDKEVYHKGFWDNSDTSSAWMNIGTRFRIIMAWIGILLIIGLISSCGQKTADNETNRTYSIQEDSVQVDTLLERLQKEDSILKLKNL